MIRRTHRIAALAALAVAAGSVYPLSGAAARQLRVAATHQLTIVAITPLHHGKVSGSITATYGPAGATVRLTCRLPSTGRHCTYQVPDRARVRFRARGSADLSFLRWSIKGSGNARTSKRSTTSVTMNQDYTVEAIFAAARSYRLTIQQGVVLPKSGSGGKGSHQPPLREAGGTVSVAYTNGGKAVSHSCRLIHCVYQVPLGARILASESVARGFRWKGWQIKAAGIPLRTSSGTSVHVTASRAFVVMALYTHP